MTTRSGGKGQDPGGNGGNSVEVGRAIDGPSHTRARVDQRIAEIVQLMSDHRWVRGKTGYELATKWGVPYTTVESYAKTASRLVRSAIDPEDVRDQVTRVFDTVIARALEYGELKEATKAAAELRDTHLGPNAVNEEVGRYVTALFVAFAERLPPDVYTQVLEVARGVQLEAVKKQPRKLKVRVDDE